MTRKQSNLHCRCAGLAFASLAFVLPAKAQDDQGGDYYPADPARLLAVLPAPPDGWKLTLSMARERLSYALVPESLAVRQYHFTPPPPLPGQAPAGPQDVMLTLLDTGHDPERLRPFDNFKPGTDPKSSAILVMGLPANKIVNGTETFLTIKISDRFVLSAQFSNMQQPDIDRWTQKIIPLQKMAEASAATPNTPLQSGPITLTYIDGLKPSTNFQSKTSFLNKGDAAIIRAHPQTP